MTDQNLEKRALIENHLRSILSILDLDPEDPAFAQTPQRVAKMYVEEIFYGLDPATFPEIHLEEGAFPQEMILVKNISLTSYCAHHLLPMIGKAHIAYIPNRQLIGFSNIHRIVDHFAKRPQLQERLTAQICAKLSELLQTEDVAVILDLKQYCIMARSVEDHATETRTHLFQGAFLTDPFRSELVGSI